MTVPDLEAPPAVAFRQIEAQAAAVAADLSSEEALTPKLGRPRPVAANLVRMHVSMSKRMRMAGSVGVKLEAAKWASA